MKHKDVWSDRYKNVYYEICHFNVNKYTPKGIWNIYIFVDIRNERVKKEFNLRKKKTKLVNTYFWYPFSKLRFQMIGGNTFYEKGLSYIKLGNDYNHIWNEGCDYDENWMKLDAESMIDKLLEMYPDLIEVQS